MLKDTLQHGSMKKLLFQRVKNTTTSSLLQLRTPTCISLSSLSSKFTFLMGAGSQGSSVCLSFTSRLQTEGLVSNGINTITSPTTIQSSLALNHIRSAITLKLAFTGNGVAPPPETSQSRSTAFLMETPGCWIRKDMPIRWTWMDRSHQASTFLTGEQVLLIRTLTSPWENSTSAEVMSSGTTAPKNNKNTTAMTRNGDTTTSALRKNLITCTLETQKTMTTTMSGTNVLTRDLDSNSSVLDGCTSRLFQFAPFKIFSAYLETWMSFGLCSSSILGLSWFGSVSTLHKNPPLMASKMIKLLIEIICAQFNIVQFH